MQQIFEVYIWFQKDISSIFIIFVLCLLALGLFLRFCKCFFQLFVMSQLNSSEENPKAFRAPLPPPSALSAASLIKSIRSSKFTSESASSTGTTPSNGSQRSGRKSKFSDLPPASVPPPGVVAAQSLKVDPVAAAAAAAAKINANLKAKGKLSDQTLMKPMINSGMTATPLSLIKISETKKIFSSYITKIDINDLPLSSRNYFTQVGIQESINKETGVAISTKGHYIPPDEQKLLDGIDKQLHLYIQSPSKEKNDLAVAKLKEMISKQKIPAPPSTVTLPSVVALPPIKPIPPGQPALPTGNFVQEKVFVGMDFCAPEFDLKTKLIGVNYANFNFVANATGAKVILRGKGSGFIEPTSGREAFESMYVFISHLNQVGVDAAKKLVYNLISTVNSEYNTYRAKKSAAGSTKYVPPTNSFPQYPVPMPAPSNPYGNVPPPTSAYASNLYATPPPPVPANPYSAPPPAPNTFYPSPAPVANPYNAVAPPSSMPFNIPLPKPADNVSATPKVPSDSSKKDTIPSQYNNIVEPKGKKRRFQEEQPDDSNVLGYKQYSAQIADNENGKKAKKKLEKEINNDDTAKHEEKQVTNLPFWMSHN